MGLKEQENVAKLTSKDEINIFVKNKIKFSLLEKKV